ncbi:MAG: radical SAM family heme chaperone HemW [Chitinophagales bacterium]|nr:radical SAM family heme chaperone HemW [Chitinophagales bacterium]
MAGIYLHIPFCKQACAYCNFHFSTLLKYKESVLNSMLQELEMRKNFFPEKTEIDTIYFGGGTPSLLSTTEINRLLQQIYRLFTVTEQPEITLEANPDDLTQAYLQALKKETPINRFSIGIQSFTDDDLHYMHRAHTAKEALQSIQFAQQAGFDNLSIDLIYGTPTLNNEQWRKNLQTAFSLNLPHISCYALTVENKTALAIEIDKKKKAAVDEELMVQQFSILLEEMKQHGYLQYEISNFCQPPHFARHNTNYWKGISYLGIGPSAHSFDGKIRYWNISNNSNYVKKIIANESAFEQEILADNDRYNEYVMTSLRTIFGVDSLTIKQNFGTIFLQHFQLEITPFIDNKWVECNDGIYTLTDSGKLFCDYITEELFILKA